MTLEQDPHSLVALMNFVVDGKQGHAPRRSAPSFGDVKHGIRDDDDANHRTFPVLDAIASISVSNAKSQVVAVAIQLDPETREARLSVAENQDVKDDLIRHLKSVWGKLRDLSDTFADKRGTGSDVYSREPSPEIPKDIADDLKVDIFCEIYKHTIKKQEKRFRKWWHGLVRLFQDMAQKRGDDGLTDTETTLARFVTLMFDVRELSARLPTQQLRKEERQQLYEWSAMATEHAGAVLEAKGDSSCEMLAKEFRGMHQMLSD